MLLSVRVLLEAPQQSFRNPLSLSFCVCVPVCLFVGLFVCLYISCVSVCNVFLCLNVCLSFQEERTEGRVECMRSKSII